MFRTIIAGYDGSEEGRDALALAGLLAGESAEQVVAATVAEATRIRLPGQAGRKVEQANASLDVIVYPRGIEPDGGLGLGEGDRG